MIAGRPKRRRANQENMRVRYIPQPHRDFLTARRHAVGGSSGGSECLGTVCEAPQRADCVRSQPGWQFQDQVLIRGIQVSFVRVDTQHHPIKANLTH